MYYKNLTILRLVFKLILKEHYKGGEMAKLTCFDVANYYLSLPNEDVGDSITHLKLQKLLYYAQGFSLALYGESLFEEPIEAWEHGPVIRVLYDQYKGLGANPIPVPEGIDFSKYGEQTKGLLNEVYEQYGQFSAWKLRDMSHEEEPWIKGNNRASKIISNAYLKKFFSTQIEDD